MEELLRRKTKFLVPLRNFFLVKKNHKNSEQGGEKKNSSGFTTENENEERKTFSSMPLTFSHSLSRLVHTHSRLIEKLCDNLMPPLTTPPLIFYLLSLSLSLLAHFTDHESSSLKMLHTHTHVLCRYLL
jgi:hypothetical protein